MAIVADSASLAFTVMSRGLTTLDFFSRTSRAVGIDSLSKIIYPCDPALTTSALNVPPAFDARCCALIRSLRPQFRVYILSLGCLNTSFYVLTESQRLRRPSVPHSSTKTLFPLLVYPFLVQFFREGPKSLELLLNLCIKESLRRVPYIGIVVHV